MVWSELFPDPVFIWHFIQENGEFKYFEHAQVRTFQNIEHSSGTLESFLVPNKDCQTNFLEKVFPEDKFLVSWPDLDGVELRNSEDETPTVIITMEFSFWNGTFWDDLASSGVRNHLEMNILSQIGNKEVDLDNINEPIRQTPDIKKRMLIKSGTYTEASITIQKNEVYLEDSWLPIFGDVEPEVFYSVGDSSMEYYNFVDQEIPGAVVITFVASNHVYQYKRKMLALLEVTGMIGGVFEIFEVLLGVFLGFYTSYSFKKDIKRDISDAEERFLKMQDSIRKLQECQKGILNRMQSQEENKEEVPLALLRTKNQVHQQEIMRSNRAIEEMIKSHKQVNDFDPLPEEYNFQPEHNQFASFKESLDWVNIVYSLKTLRLQVDYLLSKDIEYTNLSENMMASEDQVFSNFKARNQNYRSQPRVYPESNIHAHPQNHTKTHKSVLNPNLPRYQRVKRYLDKN